MENNQNAELPLPKPNANANANNGEQVENPNSDRPDEQQQDSVAGSLEMADQSSPPAASARLSSRTPFTNLSQVDADLALARTLQEQERAYMMLRLNNDGSDYGSWEAGSYLHDDEDDFNDFHDETDADDDGDEEDEYEGTDVENDEDAFDAHAHHDDDGEDNSISVEYDPAVFSSDEAYARALQDAEEREMAARLLALAGINDHEVEDSEPEESGDNSQDAWEEVDPDELSYEELLALGEVVGTESRGLSASGIASLPSVNYKTGSSQSGSNDSCVICRLDYEDGETLTLLSCKHSYHPECINNWLKINKVCPVCSTEVSTSGNS
ncbi:E3 ubiquitin ligase BIG BROTHER-related [Morus notabilis]|uniref:E3 ubiquitin ligase BIG BROTHER-related n=1 Tax=Morus notabilis TaxID=981085 RepID=UPI000CECEFB2|nr:E3 ubiquitin ligase BIG BROTHER-related [Morus notabilis]XP_024031926.1 E3 ubiquitin ligase BIG BROTHER-related [Morus notabilis]XP_024031927.1 E3 ubiquitin ligase BIG BROTHER-related [Morus notabilis]